MKDGSLLEQSKPDASRIFYYVCIACSAVALIVFLTCRIWNVSLVDVIPGQCILLKYTGYYCAGCGGTRSVMALVHGDFISCFKYHPAVFYTVVLFGMIIVSHTLSILTNNRIKAMKVRPIYFYILIAVILIQWIVKDALIWLYDIHII